MPLAPRQLEMLRHYWRFGPMTTTQMKARLFPNDTNGRSTRRAHERLRREGLLRRYAMHVLNPRNGASFPVHDITDRGREVLSVELGSDSYVVPPLSTIPPMHLYHATCVAGIYMTFHDAIANQDLATLGASYREHEVINKDESDRQKHISLFTLLSEKPRLVCQPDMAFELSVRGHKAAFYIEFETGSSGPRWVATRKHKGYANLAKRAWHKRHFPDLTVAEPFVLAIGPTTNYRNALVRHFKDREGRELWRFACASEITADSFLYEPIWHRVGSTTPYPLVKR